jgi:putative transposase
LSVPAASVPIMLVRYRHRIEPTCSQQQGLAQVFGSARVAFNDAVRLRESVRAAGGRISETQVQSAVITAAKRTEARGWLADVSSDALIQAARDCRRAYRNFINSVSGHRRVDHHHKQALDLVRDNQTIHVEDLNIGGMIRNRRLSRAISYAGSAQFLRVLGDKCARYGRDLHRIDRWYPSSQLCADCGHRDGPKPLGIRTWRCENCGAQHDRDSVAARNILAVGRAERQNACGHRVSPALREAVVDEAGTTQAVNAAGRTRRLGGGRQSSSPDLRSARR